MRVAIMIGTLALGVAGCTASVGMPAPDEGVHVSTIGEREITSERGDRTTRVRGIGWEYVHVAIDDCTRVGYAEVLADEQAETTVGFLARVVAWYAAHGITVRRLLTDNGGNYRSTALAACCRRFRIRHYFTRPYRPQTNGKAERFIRTLLHEWAYAQAYGRSSYRTRALATYLRFYNAERRHTALKFLTPLQRLATKQ